MTTRTDVLVIGGGAVGLACAVGFARLNRPVVLYGEEPPVFDPASAPSDWDLRVFALNDASIGLLRRLGAWDAIAVAPVRLCRYEEMEVWAGRGRLTFRATDVARPHLGAVVENRLLCSTLFERLRTLPGVEIRSPSRLQSLDFSGGDTARAAFDDGDVEAALVVGADGADSRVRELAGLDCARRDYGQNAIVATVATEHAHRNRCLQRFSGEGVTAFLPLAMERVGSIVWSCKRSLSDELVALSDEAFGERLAQALEKRLGTMTPASGRVAFPLYGALVADYVRRGAALVGDAAHGVHPLAGQGANMGLADVAALLDACGRVRGAGRARLGWAALRRYQRGVKGRNLAVKLALDGIFRGFVGRRAPPVALQAAGLTLVGRCLPLKRWFIRRAAGE